MWEAVIVKVKLPQKAEYVGSNIDFDWVQEGVKSIVSEVESYKYGKIDEYDS